MTARLASGLPKDANSNGLTAIEQLLIDHPHSTHVVIGVIDTRKVIMDAEKDETIPYAQFQHIEAIRDTEAAASARTLMLAALKTRTGAEMLPFETEGDGDPPRLAKPATTGGGA
jgi:hypothetical protein